MNIFKYLKDGIDELIVRFVISRGYSYGLSQIGYIGVEAVSKHLNRIKDKCHFQQGMQNAVDYINNGAYKIINDGMAEAKDDLHDWYSSIGSREATREDILNIPLPEADEEFSNTMDEVLREKRKPKNVRKILEDKIGDKKTMNGKLWVCTNIIPREDIKDEGYIDECGLAIYSLVEENPYVGNQLKKMHDDEVEKEMLEGFAKYKENRHKPNNADEYL